MRKLFNKIPIKTSKDWIISGIFMTLIIYCITMIFNDKIYEFMIAFVPPKLSRLNIPESYGNLIITVLIMTVIITFILIMKRRSKKNCFITLIVGLVIAIAIFGAFKYHCYFIVNTAFTREAEYGSISNYSIEKYKQISLNSGDERLKKLISMVNSLEEVPKEEQNKLREEMKNTDYDINVWISFPTAYGYHYSLVFKTVDDKIYFNNGYYKNDYHFFQDNGLIDYANELLEIVE